MPDFNTKVIKYLNRKSETGSFEGITHLGAEQRFVGGLRNAGVSNLEEQFIVGTNTYTEKYIDDRGNLVIETSYKSESDSGNYYKLITTSYKEVQANTDYYFESGKIRMPQNNDQFIGQGGSYSPNVLYLPNREIFREAKESDEWGHGTGNMILEISPPSSSLIMLDELYYIREGQPDILVLIKETGTRYADNGNKEIIVENIIYKYEEKERSS